MKALSAIEADQANLAMSLLSQQRASDAIQIAVALRERNSTAPDAWHIEALCRAEAGEIDAADHAFMEAARLAPGQPMIIANRARWYARSRRPMDALGMWQQLMALQPGGFEAWLGSADALLILGRPIEALAGFEAAGMRGAPAVRVQLGRAAAYRAIGDLGAAGGASAEAVRIAPESIEARLDQARTARLQGRLIEALQMIDGAEVIGGWRPDIVDSRIGTLLDALRPDEALALAEQAVLIFPVHPIAHVTLAQLRWEYANESQLGDPLDAFRAAVDRFPDDMALRMALADSMLRFRQPAEAFRQIEILRRQHETPVLQTAAAHALDMLGFHDEAGALYAAADRRLGGHDVAFGNAYLRHLLHAGRIEEAAHRAERLLAFAPNHQETWAYLSTAWRLLGDPREHWLCNDEALVKTATIRCPDGWVNLSAFLSDLESCLLSLHAAHREPATQSLRRGTQTPGRLFGRDLEPVRALQEVLHERIADVLHALPADPRHPFLRRRTPAVHFGGSWSVRLWRSGCHENHFHNEGWMSSAFYVSLPPSTLAARDDAGCLQLGQPPLELGLGLPPRRMIRPAPGSLVLFPSYLWHGTVPFADDAARLTVAFDLLPALT